MKNLADTAIHGDLPWYALRIQSKLAGLALDTLGVKGFETFLPMYTSRRRWSDRVKSVEAPLFPGYLFCRFDSSDYLPILMTPGVSNILGIGNNPVAVDEDEIATVRSVLRSGLATESCSFLSVGTKIRLTYGPLAGLEGILTRTERMDRLLVSVTLLNRSVSVEIDRSWAQPISDCKAIAPSHVWA